MTLLFWMSVAGVLYPYFGYLLVLALLGRIAARRDRTNADAPLPSVTIIIPAHNEASRIGAKVANTAALDYPADRLQVLFVNDGSTDATADVIRSTMTAGMALVELRARGGKAQALNAGLAAARHDILVFSDASIALEPDALRQLVRGFSDPEVGCVSGEDRIADGGGEGLYGTYELYLRRLESRVHSIVGASGCLYAQRRSICQPFTEGMAPDFLSVLRTVEQGYRATSEPNAVGYMTSVKDPRHEFERKVRTLLRGMTTMFSYGHLLNPFRYGLFAFALISHKILRWSVPFFLIGVLLAPLGLLHVPFYALALAAQVAFYLIALAAFAGWGRLAASLPGKVALYFASVNAAIVAAWYQYARGVRQELWTPSAR